MLVNRKTVGENSVHYLPLKLFHEICFYMLSLENTANDMIKTFVRKKICVVHGLSISNSKFHDLYSNKFNIKNLLHCNIYISLLCTFHVYH